MFFERDQGSALKNQVASVAYSGTVRAHTLQAGYISVPSNITGKAMAARTESEKTADGNKSLSNRPNVGLC